jgi:Protein of unknown function (DUF1566)
MVLRDYRLLRHDAIHAAMLPDDAGGAKSADPSETAIRHSCSPRRREFVMGPNTFTGLSFLAMLFMLVAGSPAQAACTAGTPDTNLIESTPISAFTDNGDGTTTHARTGLVWKRCAQGQTWDGSTNFCNGTAATYTWAAALTAAKNENYAGHTDWRLPNKKELESIVEYCGTVPAINQTIFPATPQAAFWSGSSAFSVDPTYAWFVTFYYGNNLVNVKSTPYYARLVRGGQSIDSFDALNAAPPTVPVLQNAASRKVHGAAGTFNLSLSAVATNPTTEPRQGPAQTIVFTFDKPITAATATISEGTATAAAPTFSGNDVIVGLTGVNNQQYVTIALTNVASSDGGSGGSGSVRVGFLLGDVNQNRVVTLADLGLVNAQLAQSVTAANYLKDVNASGTLTLADKGITNANLTKALAAP